MKKSNQLTKLHQLKMKKMKQQELWAKSSNSFEQRINNKILQFPFIQKQTQCIKNVRQKSVQQNVYIRAYQKLTKRGKSSNYRYPDQQNSWLEIRKANYAPLQKKYQPPTELIIKTSMRYYRDQWKIKSDRGVRNPRLNCNTQQNQQQKSLQHCKPNASSYLDVKQYLAPQKKQYLYEALAKRPMNSKEVQLNIVYQKRIISYLQFIWKLNFYHNIYIDLNIKSQINFNRINKLKAYVGYGNNSCMIKSLLKRRFWWTLVQNRHQTSINFVWTQIKKNDIFQKQQIATKNELKYIDNTTEQQDKNTKKPLLKSYRRSFHSSTSMNHKIENNQKILHEKDIQAYNKIKNKLKRKQVLLTIQKQKIPKVLKDYSYENATIHNHLQNNFYLGNKKALFHNLKQYYNLIHEDPFEYIPLTFHIKKMKDKQYNKFINFYQQRKSIIRKQIEQQGLTEQQYKKLRNIWIVKPGENTNRGNGITVIDQIYQLNSIMKQSEKNQQKTYIVQLYIDRPFLYQNRKFDIRHFMLITHIHGIMRAYWYEQGYIRTSSSQFNINNFQPQIHLTNDAIQKNYPQYGKYQIANKISYQQFQRYLDITYNKKYNFNKDILMKMKKIALDCVKSVYMKISPKMQKHNFQIFGFDFMIDRKFKPWLIEINANPCLEVNCNLLDRIIPYMVEQSLKLSLDVVYPPPAHYPNNDKYLAPYINLQNFQYELIFDSQIDGKQIEKLYKKVKGNLINQIGEIDEDQVFKDEGKQIKLDNYA